MNTENGFMDKNEDKFIILTNDLLSNKKNLKEKMINQHQQTQLMNMFYIELYGNLPSIEGLDLQESVFEKLNKAFENKKKLTKKNEKANSEIKFACKICPKVYKSKENLKLHHMNFHLNKKPYTCKVCSKQFSNRMGILYHTKSFHPDLE